MTILAVVLGLAIVGLAPSAFAQDAGGMRAACGADFQKYCAATEPGPGRRQCLLENKDKLSDACNAALAGLVGGR